MDIILVFLVLALVVYVHELGHYVAMRRSGVTVLDFSIGFGPVLWSRPMKAGGVFTVRLLPLGGFVMPVAEGPGSVASVSPWAQCKIFVAGMFFNATAAFLLAVPACYLTNIATVFVLPGTLGDISNTAILPAVLKPLWQAFMLSYGIWLATPFVFVGMIASGLQTLFAGMAGPIAIVAGGSQMIGSAPTAIGKLGMCLILFGALNGGLAGFNLLPILPLDGGHLAVLAMKKLGVDPGGRLMKAYQMVCVAFFLLLIVSIFASDIARLFR